jgi:hypothetical protein
VAVAPAGGSGVIGIAGAGFTTGPASGVTGVTGGVTVATGSTGAATTAGSAPGRVGAATAVGTVALAVALSAGTNPPVTSTGTLGVTRVVSVTVVGISPGAAGSMMGGHGVRPQVLAHQLPPSMYFALHWPSASCSV